MKTEEYEGVIKELTKELKTQCCLVNQYGIILGSSIKEFPKDSVLHPKILKLVANRKNVAKSLDLESIKSFILESKDFFYVFNFSNDLILISKLTSDIDLTKYSKNINAFLARLVNKIHQLEEPDVSSFDFSEEITQMEHSIQNRINNKEKYSVIKDLVKYISELK
ncbi:MAG: hypothetical protein BAJALOKI1v1_960004 [Promethearchaeota archaeon]|nr:MAG: hypothetical protein BAJALOKI1v1_960004 [Candidatus Lokiarchaeota archaeon]